MTARIAEPKRYTKLFGQPLGQTATDCPASASASAVSTMRTDDVMFFEALRSSYLRPSRDSVNNMELCNAREALLSAEWL